VHNPPDTETSAVASRGDWHPDEKDAESVEDTAHKAGVGRSIIYRALNPDPAKRGGLPFLPSLKVRKRRLIRAEARRAWLRQLEELESASAQGRAAVTMMPTTGAPNHEPSASSSAPKRLRPPDDGPSRQARSSHDRARIPRGILAR
jgi:hypothetical protein